MLWNDRDNMLHQYMMLQKVARKKKRKGRIVVDVEGNVQYKSTLTYLFLLSLLLLLLQCAILINPASPCYLCYRATL